MAEFPDSADVVDNQHNEDGDEQTRRCWKFSPSSTRVFYWILMVRNIVGKKLQSIYHPAINQSSSSLLRSLFAGARFSPIFSPHSRAAYSSNTFHSDCLANHSPSTRIRNSFAL